MYVIYIAGPYNAPTKEEVQKNIEHARAAAVRLIKAGYAVICPHLNTAGLEDAISDQQIFYRMSVELLTRCDGIYLLKGWSESKGAKIEMNVAVGLNMDIYAEGIKEPPGVDS